jgi:hypothetical protein
MENKTPDTNTDIPSYTNFHCPIMQTNLVKTCECKECPYWVDYKPADNCTLSYMQQQGVNQLSVTELGYLKRWFLTSVSKTHLTALSKIRNIIIFKAAADGHIKRDFFLKPSPSVCVNCECTMIPEKHHKKMDGLGYVWCSKECVQELPFYEVHMRHLFGCKSKEVCSWLVRNLWEKSLSFEKNIKVLEQALKIPAKRLTAAFLAYDSRLASHKVKKEDQTELELLSPVYKEKAVKNIRDPRPYLKEGTLAFEWSRIMTLVFIKI